MWNLESSVVEIVVRAGVIYFCLFFMFRLLGKKPLGELSPFDLVLLLIVSESVSNGLGANENSLFGALISAATLLFLNYSMDSISYWLPSVETMLDGKSKVLIEDGKVIKSVQNSERISTPEIERALRELEIFDIKKVKKAVLETNGQITAEEAN